MTVYNTRIAPSPTGMMHVGTARTAYYNWLAARATGGKFYLRIDDTDADRNDMSLVQPIVDGMRWLGLDYDASFNQSNLKRRKYCDGIATKLVDAGYAIVLDNGAIALKWCDWMPTTWHDDVSGDMAVTDTLIKQIDGMILVRGGDKLGQPTYHFASVCDDYAYDINYIIRGHDHRDNTAKQLAIWAAIAKVDGKDFVPPRFAHVALMFKDGKKMSKRDGAASLLDYRDAGVDPDAFLNFLLLMGWGKSGDPNASKIIPMDAAKDVFVDGGKFISRDRVGFDQHILNSFDRKYKAAKDKYVRVGDSVSWLENNQVIRGIVDHVDVFGYLTVAHPCYPTVGNIRRDRDYANDRWVSARVKEKDLLIARDARGKVVPPRTIVHRGNPFDKL